MSRIVLLIACALLFLGVAVTADTAEAPAEPRPAPGEASQLPVETSRFVEAVRRILPADWRITAVQRGSIPPDWVSCIRQQAILWRSLTYSPGR